MQYFHAGRAVVQLAQAAKKRTAEDQGDQTRKEGVLKEFKFPARGSIVELAVAFVPAWRSLRSSTRSWSLVMPLVAMIIGKPDFSDLTFTINDAVFRYGAFITDVISPSPLRRRSSSSS